MTICDSCSNTIEGEEIYHSPDADLCAWCHQSRYGDDMEGEFTFHESQKGIANDRT